ncbi:Arginase/deacetylase [Vararia minispora EC-137]|uniref:Arginase/deacetylase n=1 Tax=Vararia minispora EC-137 TaxID=1314806 RepID=A0ACB8QYT0_9AGAM|nr:Arginase/deacetylase [Vararia minispora EC-137]
MYFLRLPTRSVLLSALVLSAQAHSGQNINEETFVAPPSTQTWLEKYGQQTDLGYTGPLSFAHLPYARCLEDAEPTFDIAILGMPFDTTVSYRPGARFGPAGIRTGARRLSHQYGYSLSWGFDPYKLGSKVIDCGDIPLNGYDNAVAIDQMEVAYSTLLARPVAKTGDGGFDATSAFAKDGRAHPRILTLGGDHTVVLPILRALNKVYGPIAVIHFDSHFDTGNPGNRSLSAQSRITHGSYFHIANEEGLIRNNSIHGGIRQKFNGAPTIENDEAVGFKIVSADDIDDIGIKEVVRRIRGRIGDAPVYFSLDIDVVDPGMAPATGTPEVGGWTVREVRRIIRGLSGLNFVGADVVEVAPAYDHADITNIAAADIAQDFMAMMLAAAPPKSRDERKPWKDEL